jgi:hypothetical protein
MGQDKDFSYHKAVAILATAFRILLRTKQLSNCAASFCSVLEINRPLSISNQCLAYRTISAGSRCSNAAGMLSDSPLLNGVRWQAITFMQAGSLFGAVIIAVWTVPKGLLFVAYYMSYMSAGVPGIYYSWFPELIPHDHEMRGFLTAFSNIFSYVNQIWVSDAVWRTAEAPRFRPGFIWASVFSAVLISLSIILHSLEVSDRKKREAEVGEIRQVDIETAIEK